MPADSSQATSQSHGLPNDLFVLTDEQILEIEPAPEVPSGEWRVPSENRSSVISSEARPLPLGAPSAPRNLSSSGGALDTDQSKRDSSSPAAPRNDGTETEEASAVNGAGATPTPANATNAPFAASEDLRALAELYPGGLTQAQSAADRARTLDEMDAAYFGEAANSPEQISAARAQLAHRLLQENPTAFREMVFAGLRALENAGHANPQPSGAAISRPRAVPGTGAADTGAPPPNSAVAARHAAPHLGDASTREAQAGLPAPPEHLAAYSAFEKAANEELERSVGGAIDRALQIALPALETDHASGAVGQRAPLRERFSAAIRQDVESALQGDRQLGEQVAQILSARRFDNETRAQVVRLINDRAQQLVPVAAKRALNDWTQATLSAHRSQTRRSSAAASRREVPAAASSARDAQAVSSTPANGATQTPAQTSRRPASQSRVDYRRLSDDQILDL